MAVYNAWGRAGKETHELNQFIGQRVWVHSPHAITVWKIGAMAVAMKCPLEVAHLVTQQLTHTSQTDVLHYQAIHAPSHAAQAFKTMEELRKRQQSECKNADEKLGKRVPFSPTDVQEMKRQFKQFIQDGRCPSSTERTAFLKRYPITGKNRKDVQDKVHSVYREAKGEKC